MKALVIPTCRADRIAEFLRQWEPLIGDLKVFVIEDSPKSHLPYAYDWEHITNELGSLEWIISRRDSAIRSFGFCMAWREGAELIITLDDDCLPGPMDRPYWQGGSLSLAHERAMEIPRFRSSLRDVRVRGLPYNTQLADPAVVNVGLWEGVLDFDAINQLSGPAVDEIDHATIGSNCLPAGQYVPMCGMNMAFSRAAAPLMYFGLQGQGRPVGRFDDIWCGVLAKRISDHLGWRWTYGLPIIHHTRASNPFSNLVKEAPGVAEHETYWQYIDRMEFKETDAVGCMMEAAEQIGKYEPKFLPRDYFIDLAKATAIWASLFDP
jgi:reversibly glycosylated polypeptide/UDP-arabinopyranose mutase